jgi:lipopolysaccharide transport system permease protein
MIKLSRNALLWDFATLALILIGASLIAVQFRLKIFAGSSLGSEYEAQTPLLYVIFITCALLGAVVHQMLAERQVFTRASKRTRFFVAIVVIGIAFLLVAFLLPDVSLLQMFYFVLTAIVLAAVTLRFTPTRIPLSACLQSIWRNRALFQLWVRYNVLSRYSQTFLGIVWIVMLPLATSVILSVVFSFIMQARDIGDAPFMSFFLTGLTFWTLFTQGVLTGTVSVLQKMDLINQIYFPREILVIVKLGEALVDLTFTFLVLLAINALNGIFPNANFIYLPLVLGIQIALTLGIMFYTSFLSVLVRDLPQLISVVLQMLFYLTPVLFPLELMPIALRGIITVANPMASIISAYRSIIVYNQPPDLISLYFSLVLSGLVLYTGYMFFKNNERKLADYR